MLIKKYFVSFSFFFDQLVLIEIFFYWIGYKKRAKKKRESRTEIKDAIKKAWQKVRS